MDAEVLYALDVADYATNHPIFSGAAIKNGKIRGVFIGHDHTHPLLLLPSQIEHLTGLLATRDDFNAEHAIGEYALALRQTTHAAWALEREWIKPGAFINIPDGFGAKAPPVSSSLTIIAGDDRITFPPIPSGVPGREKGIFLRELLGKRHPELDDLYMDGAEIKIDAYNGEGPIGRITKQVRLDPGEILEIVPGALRQWQAGFVDGIPVSLGRLHRLGEDILPGNILPFLSKESRPPADAAYSTAVSPSDAVALDQVAGNPPFRPGTQQQRQGNILGRHP